MGKSLAAASITIHNCLATTKNLKPSKPTPRFLRKQQQKEKLKMEANSDVQINGVSSSSSGGGDGGGGNSNNNLRLPLSEVVADCVKRWFKDTLKEAKNGDINMQVLVGQMYYSGYGIPRDEQKGRIWISKASRTRSSVWKLSDKRPGYNASDSDSDEVKGDSQ
ncbi:uncharacterized protein LOC126663182 [Mercurialis annua]|uniref:uncharacterized protein LOC126663182 n=1 Tax=Mercurialis annua TaxID=3986 RepID=UPI00216004D7|nr:uncharacterized protein LOC126663182 [Mercurialis annua]